MSYMQKLTEAQNHRCGYCGHRMVSYGYIPRQTMPRNTLTKDHVEPRTYGGVTHIDNLIAACLQCNNLRGEMEAIAFYNLMQKWFKRDSTLRQRWHQLTRTELYALKVQCVMVHERQLRGMAIRHIEYAFRHFTFVCSRSNIFRRA